MKNRPHHKDLCYLCFIPILNAHHSIVPEMGQKLVCNSSPIKVGTLWYNANNPFLNKCDKMQFKDNIFNVQPEIIFIMK